MRPATDFEPAQLVGKQVRFAEGEDHAECWHCRVAAVSGKVRELALSLAQKAQMFEDGGMDASELRDREEGPPRAWILIDPSPLFPGGCEAAVELDCLFVVE